MHGKILETFYNDIPACPEEIRLLFWAEGRWIKNIYDGHSSNWKYLLWLYIEFIDSTI